MREADSDVIEREWRAAQDRWLTELVNVDFHGDATGRAFVTRDPAEIDPPIRMPAAWSPVPRQLLDCLGADGTRDLCDWTPIEPATAPDSAYPTLRGGREYHTEYCEYAIVLDSTHRPKRVEITTELRESWLGLAVHAPERLRAEAAERIGPSGGSSGSGGNGAGPPAGVTFDDLYGRTDPVRSTAAEREHAFERNLGGSVVKQDRVVPQGRLNRDHALFMSVPINGLDDLYYIALLAARRFARSVRGQLTAAPLPWLFLDNPYFRDHPADQADLARLYCTHADPAVARAVQLAAWQGRRIALDPLAVVLRRADFAVDRLIFPPGCEQRWVRWTQPVGAPERGLFQRLVIGPGDDEPALLDAIGVRSPSGATAPLTGGYQLFELLAVGLEFVVGPPGMVRLPAEPLHPQRPSISCAEITRARSAELTDALARARATPVPTR